MKKLLLIAAIIAYIFISCDKPETISVEEPTTNIVDTSADTCAIYVSGTGHTIAMLYHTTSTDIDFDASFKSIQRNFTITLKNGSLDTAICSNADGDYFPSDSGIITNHKGHFVGDNLKYGNYTLVLWPVIGNNMSWGPNHTSNDLRCLYHNFAFNQGNTYHHIACDTLSKLFDEITPFTAIEFN